MGYVISVTNQKGGVGKTLTASTLASLLTEKGYNVLSVDMDPQSNFSQVAGGPGPIRRYDLKSLSILDVLKQECSIEEATVQTNIGDLVRASPNLTQWTGRSLLSRRDFHDLMERGLGAEEVVALLKERYNTGWGATEHKTLDWALRNVRQRYDFVFLDTNPSLTLLTLNSLYTADFVLIPAFTEESSRKAILELKDTIEQMKAENSDMHAEILGILITKYKKRTILAGQYLKEYERLAKSMGTVLFDARIRDGLAAAEYANQREDLVRYAPKNPVTQDYRVFADEFLERIKARGGSIRG
ncbi:ParA family protein [uncultured Flavonifractor sp.]|uniref:ParA family protein n=1 Tax=uncultured Flavonifractor sp. TaxID=1193534 RepID=UPI0025952273|nr:ParA family protein [uncultured Flavonifractor sp.]